MGAQIEALKQKKAVYKPIYNHDTGNKDPPELLQPNKVMVFEGLHPIYDAKARVDEIHDGTLQLARKGAVRVECVFDGWVTAWVTDELTTWTCLECDADHEDNTRDRFDDN